LTISDGGRHRVRRARAADVDALVAAVGRLVGELRGDEAARLPSGAAEACRALVEGDDAGVALVVEDEHGGAEIVGMVAASYVHAIHAGGEYAVVQDLWVEPARRGRGLGRDLIAALERELATRGIDRIEVGLPRASFAALERTRSFYLQCGFEEVGPRMRKTLRR
jgi:para-aminobenzoate synthetase